jgi:hypothetical protein
MARQHFNAAAAIAAMALALSCGHSGSAPAPTVATGPQTSTASCGEDAPNTPAHCECLGGYVKGDIGDGQVACPQGETELERVQQGIEGAVCCKRTAD